MRSDIVPGGHPSILGLEDGIDHVRGPDSAPVVLEYGDYECPYSRQAFRAIEQVERRHPGGIRFAFRHFPLTEIHPHALAAAKAVEAAALQGGFWEMHELLFHRQHASGKATFASTPSNSASTKRSSSATAPAAGPLTRVQRDLESGEATGEIAGTPTLFIDGVVHRGAYDTTTLLEALAR